MFWPAIIVCLVACLVACLVLWLAYLRLGQLERKATLWKTYATATEALLECRARIRVKKCGASFERQSTLLKHYDSIYEAVIKAREKLEAIK